MKKVTPIILSGGVGLRLWPISTKNLPKQFLKLPFDSKFNLFEQTLLGIKKSKKFTKPIIICSEKHKFLVLESLNKLKIQFLDIIVEKLSKNTAASVLLGLIFGMKRIKAENSLILPSDHFIPNRKYSLLIPKSINFENKNIIFGIKPEFASTDYGYICPKEKEMEVSEVEAFYEKPNKKKAENFISRGSYWNSGIFLLNNHNILLDFKKLHPKMYRLCNQIIANLENDLEFLETNSKLMKQLPEISFDKAILEKTSHLFVKKFKQPWKDLGSWNTLSDISDKNVKFDPKVKIINNSSNSTVLSDRRNTIINDVPNIIVVSLKESLLISSKKNLKKLKGILENKKNKSITEYQSVFYKPWGHYEVFIDSPYYLVKKLTIKPNHRLSLQFHKFRSEHWVIVEGIAKVTKGKSKKIIRKNESTYIPNRVTHCIENIGETNLEIIEVQMGKIIKESDIVRLDDPYKREN